MPVNSYIDQARERVRAEREAVDAKLEAYEEFTDRMAELPTEEKPSPASGVTARVGTRRETTSVADERCRTVRRLFAETIRPHSVADIDGDEPLLDSIRQEFSEPVAVALAPTTATTVTSGVKETIVRETRSREAEAAALREALDREATDIEDAGDVTDDVVDWIVGVNETPLTDLGFEGLRNRHETLAAHRDRCEKLVADRQDFLDDTTRRGVEAEVSHRRLAPYLYDDFPVDYPILATVVRLEETCRESQRTVRDHLVRRA